MGTPADVKVVVTVGSDHHRFDRLIRWVDDWAARNPGADVWVQHGPSRPPEHGTGVEFSSHDELLERIGQANVVVTSAGPGTAMEIREAGLLPVLVPRRSALEECVDDHQRAFARRMASEGMALCCERSEELSAVLDQARQDPTALRLRSGSGAEPPARGRVGELIDELITERRK